MTVFFDDFFPYPEWANELKCAGQLFRLLNHHFESFTPDLALEFISGALCDCAAMVDHNDVVREYVSLVEVLRRQHQRCTSRDEFLDDVPHVDATTWVQTGRGFIKEQHRRVRDECSSEVESPAHAAGVPLCDAIPGVLKSELCEEFPCAFPTACFSQVISPADHLTVLEPGEVLVNSCVLTGGADFAAHLLRLVTTSSPATVALPRRASRAW